MFTLLHPLDVSTHRSSRPWIPGIVTSRMSSPVGISSRIGTNFGPMKSEVLVMTMTYDAYEETDGSVMDQRGRTRASLDQSITTDIYGVPHTGPSKGVQKGGPKGVPKMVTSGVKTQDRQSSDH